jgi:hypothetical protein
MHDQPDSPKPALADCVREAEVGLADADNGFTLEILCSAVAHICGPDANAKWTLFQKEVALSLSIGFTGRVP